MPKGTELSDSQRADIIDASQVIGDHLIGLGRAYVKSVMAPNREENKEQEAKFKQRLARTVTALIESGVFR